VKVRAARTAAEENPRESLAASVSSRRSSTARSRVADIFAWPGRVLRRGRFVAAVALPGRPCSRWSGSSPDLVAQVFVAQGLDTTSGGRGG